MDDICLSSGVLHVKWLKLTLYKVFVKNLVAKTNLQMTHICSDNRAKVGGARHFQVWPPLGIRFPYVYASRDLKRRTLKTWKALKNQKCQTLDIVQTGRGGSGKSVKLFEYEIVWYQY